MKLIKGQYTADNNLLDAELSDNRNGPKEGYDKKKVLYPRLHDRPIFL